MDEMMDDIAAGVEQDAEQEHSQSIVNESEAQEEDFSVSEKEFIRRSQSRVEAFALQEGRKLAYGAASIVFFVILIFLLLFSGSLMKRFPAMQGLYKLFGIHMQVPDVLSLMFEGVYADVRGSAVSVRGRIINLSRQAWHVPMIEISVYKTAPSSLEVGSGQGEIVARWVEAPPQNVLEAEKEVQFSYSRHVSFGEKILAHDSKGSNVDEYMARVRFVVGAFPDHSQSANGRGQEDKGAHEPAGSIDAH